MSSIQPPVSPAAPPTIPTQHLSWERHGTPLISTPLPILGSSKVLRPKKDGARGQRALALYVYASEGTWGNEERWSDVQKRLQNALGPIDGEEGAAYFTEPMLDVCERLAWGPIGRPELASYHPALAQLTTDTFGVPLALINPNGHSILYLPTLVDDDSRLMETCEQALSADPIHSLPVCAILCDPPANDWKLLPITEADPRLLPPLDPAYWDRAARMLAFYPAKGKFEHLMRAQAVARGVKHLLDQRFDQRIRCSHG